MNRKHILQLVLLLMPGYVVAATPCTWGEWASDSCNCEPYKEDMKDAISGDPDAQFRVWKLMTFSAGSIYKSFLPDGGKLPDITKELQRCKTSITSKGRLKLEEQGHVWLNLAADSGHIEAQYFLGMYIWDKEWRHDTRLTKMRLISCRLQSDNFVDTCSRTLTYKPIGFQRLTRKDVDENRVWVNSKTYEGEFSPRIEQLIRKAAEAKHINAQFALAEILQEGVGVPIDEVQAQAWRITGTAQNPPYGDNIRDGYLAKYWLSPEEVAKAYALAEEFMRKYTDLWDNPSLTIFQ